MRSSSPGRQKWRWALTPVTEPAECLLLPAGQASEPAESLLSLESVSCCMRGPQGLGFSRAGISKILMDMRSCRHAHRAIAMLLCTSHVKQILFNRVSLGALWRRRSARQWRLHRRSRMQQSWQSFVPASNSRCCLP